MPFSALITGSKSGIGLELARQLLATLTPSDHVFATCRDPAVAPELKQLQEQHSNLHVLQLDVDNVESYATVVEQVGKTVPAGAGLNVLINNAAVVGQRALQDQDADNMTSVFRTNCVSPLLLAKAFLPLLKDAAASCPGPGMSWKRACILNINSRMGSVEDNRSGGVYAYRASKVALNAITRSLGVDLRADNILVVSMDPGWVKTKLGGPNAKITSVESASRILAAMHTMTEEQSSTYVDHFGKPIPW